MSTHITSLYLFIKIVGFPPWHEERRTDILFTGAAHLIIGQISCVWSQVWRCGLRRGENSTTVSDIIMAGPGGQEARRDNCPTGDLGPPHSSPPHPLPHNRALAALL